jgi:hypothetical protein
MDTHAHACLSQPGRHAPQTDGTISEPIGYI